VPPEPALGLKTQGRVTRMKASSATQAGRSTPA
jgi:hypothetical protein